MSLFVEIQENKDWNRALCFLNISRNHVEIQENKDWNRMRHRLARSGLTGWNPRKQGLKRRNRREDFHMRYLWLKSKKTRIETDYQIASLSLNVLLKSKKTRIETKYPLSAFKFFPLLKSKKTRIETWFASAPETALSFSLKSKKTRIETAFLSILSSSL